MSIHSYFNVRKNKQECFKNNSNSISMNVTPVVPWNVTVECVGRKITKKIDLKKIGKEHQSKYLLCNPVLLKESNQ